MPVILALVVLSLLAVPQPASAQAPATVQIQEWTVPWPASRPRDPYVAPDGRIWFVGQRSDYAAVLDPKTGEFERFELGEGTGPHNLIVASDGAVWFAGNRAAHIGVLHPADGRIERVAMPDGHPRDPHTLIFDPAGDIWFTAQGANTIGKLDVETRELRILDVPTPNARPYGIVVEESGRPWAVLVGTNKVATIDPQSFELREYTLPADGARPRRVALGKDGGVWYVDFARGYLGRLDPATGQVREWAAPAGAESRPYAMTVDDRGRMWFVETGAEPNTLVGFDPAAERFISVTPIPSGAGAVRHMVFDPKTRSIWFGTDFNTIGRALVP